MSDEIEDDFSHYFNATARLSKEVQTLTTTLASCNRARQEEGRQRDAALAQVEVLKKALLGTAHAHDGTEWCWCAYTTLVHPPDDPQDGVAVDRGHTADCWQARAALATTKTVCPEGCKGLDLGEGNFSGCSCGTPFLANGQPWPEGFKCDCPNHPGVVG
jgi:hypothetical protein